jgi:hypothetical protein
MSGSVATTGTGFDWKNPDYRPILAQRADRLRRLRAHPELLGPLREKYRADPAAFIGDWGVTTDPRSIATGRAALVPFLLWPKQIELVRWMMARWRNGESGSVVKSRDVGASFIAMSLLCTLCIFERNFAAGVASAVEVKLDRLGDPDTLFHKAREFMRHLPAEFRAGYIEDKHSAYLRLQFPHTGSSLTGEAGDNAGRGGRKSLYIVDESAHFARPKLIDASLAATTDCRIDMSSVNGVANSFYERAHNPQIPRFDITWRDDQRKDQAWYEAKAARTDPVILAQEWDCNFSASMEGVLLPSSWVSAAVDAHKRLGITPAGIKMGGLDVADEGIDRNCFAGRHGILLEHLESWSGKGSDIFRTVQRALNICDDFGYTSLSFDADGLGAGCRGDANVINEGRRNADKPVIRVREFRGSGAIVAPEKKVPNTNRTNNDMFGNFRAMCAWYLRLRLQQTYRAVIEGMTVDPDSILSIDSHIPELNELLIEAARPQFYQNSAGRILIDKAPNGMRSPNRFDALVIAFAPLIGAADSWLRLIDKARR